MSIRSSIFTSKTTDAEYQFLNKGILPPLISPTLPPIYKSLTNSIPPIQLPPSKSVVTNGRNSYTVMNSAKGSSTRVIVRLKVGLSGNHQVGDESIKPTKKRGEDRVVGGDDDEPLIKKRSPVKKPAEIVQPNAVDNKVDTKLDTKLDQVILDKRKEKSELFIGKSKHFRNLAASKKRESDELRHNQHAIKSILLSLESVITFVIAFDYEDKSRLVEKKLITDKSWITLEPYLNSIIKIIKDNLPVNKKLRWLLAVASLLKGVCYQHMIKITLALIHNSQLKINRESKDEKIAALKELVYSKSVLLVDYQHETSTSFQLFEENLNHLEIKLNFPKTFKKRSLTINPVQKQESLKPDSDVFYIPLSNISSLQEVVAFSHRIINEFPSTQ